MIDEMRARTGIVLRSVSALIFVLLTSCGAPSTEPMRVTGFDEPGILPPTPRRYICPRAAGLIFIDGRVEEAGWMHAPWSERFVDIEGERKPHPRFETRVRMCWDDRHLYIAAELEEPHVWATLTEHDSIVFHDNDFEVFIDPDGDGREYYEIEVNALNTIFDLRLVNSYRKGGPAVQDWTFEGLRSAVRVRGTLSDPSDVDSGWSVEMALPWTTLAEYSSIPMPPDREGVVIDDGWRINFSRVQWRHDIVDGTYHKQPEAREDNWVWSPQGEINMHIPEQWGKLIFTRSGAQSRTYRRASP